MRQKFSVATRKLVATRANFRCEYCRRPDLTANFSFHIEHIISRQHGGSDNPANLDFNTVERILERTELIEAGIYP